MKHVTFIAAIVAAAGLAAGGAALAKGDGHHGPKMSFEEIDADGNGEVTKAEIQALKEARFGKADTDGNGVLTLEEMQAHAQAQANKRAARMLERFDKDGDGALSKDELPEPRRAGRMFDRMDADGSGGISKQEFDEARMRHGGKHRPGHGDSNGNNTEQN
ncbi:EF-hand domain-containing protein [Leisingera methylohalidivorans]|uniref:Calcium-binding protein n=1 Tax=Leisingera methylohalidivorans DSM 14336 TaxID=999552 RepID=V9VVX3_9RHOB|nr:EF-hand domain-containing protein [Leisingera methylohalidivorans]AHD01525.1 calcium-binding protein [Leisingera methylohalidivorans DSM 14336]